jgi:hypothetical protein
MEVSNMRQVCFGLVCAPLLLLGLTVLPETADARRGGGGFHAGGGHAYRQAPINRNVTRNVTRTVDRNINRNVNVNRNVSRNVTRDVNRRYVYHNGRRGYWRNGVFVALPVAGAAAAGYAASCAYEYNRWQSTGSSYWRDRYYRCAQ